MTAIARKVRTILSIRFSLRTAENLRSARQWGATFLLALNVEHFLERQYPEAG